jgi:nucleotide-binding universal stress UspA family protein
MNTILIATDGSAGAHAAVTAGLEVARETGARVLFLGVRHPPRSAFGEPHWQNSVTHELGRLRPALRAAVAEADELGIDADYDLLEGNPAEEIVRVARARDVDLIVLGCRGLGAVASLLLGSVSKRVIRDADRLVLVVKERRAVATSP